MALEKLGESLSADRFTHVEVNKFVSTPEQLQALRLCQELGDPDHKNIYLHLCKYTAPGLIEEALSFVRDAQARDKGKLFCWKVKQLRLAWQAAGKNPHRAVTPRPRRPKIVPPAAPVVEQLPLF